MFIRSEAFYKDRRISLVSGQKVCGIDSDNKRVILDSGREEAYDRLLIAVGSVPFVPSIEGLPGSEYHTINSLKDADTIREKAERGGTAVVIGGGLTGIEMGFAFRRLGMNVYVVEKAESILPAQLDGDSSDIMIQQLGKEGIKVLKGSTVRRVLSSHSHGRSSGSLKGRIELEDGMTIDYSMLAVTIGTRPDLEMVKGTSIECNRGILVDEYMRTNVEDVYAAGDAMEIAYGPSKGYISAYTWPNALAQGKCAAFNMVGQPQRFPAFSGIQNPIMLRDMPFISIGLINPTSKEYDIYIFCNKTEGIYKKVVIKDNRIEGAILLGDTGMANVISGFIKSGANVRDFTDELLHKNFYKASCKSVQYIDRENGIK